MVCSPEEVAVSHDKGLQTAAHLKPGQSEAEQASDQRKREIPVEPPSVFPIVFPDPQLFPQLTHSQEEDNKMCSQDAK